MNPQLWFDPICDLLWLLTPNEDRTYKVEVCSIALGASEGWMISSMNGKRRLEVWCRMPEEVEFVDYISDMKDVI